MQVIKIISEWKRRPSPKSQAKNGKVGYNEKMVQAIVQTKYGPVTRHIKMPR